MLWLSRILDSSWGFTKSGPWDVVHGMPRLSG
uniref:Uncharacterized protein n=1 Tax=Arundo donax TaxID=35708 RepID=A0A0A8ZWS9_ARUDO